MSHTFLPKSFNATMTDIIPTESLDTTLEYGMDANTYVRLSLSVYMGFLGRSNFYEKIDGKRSSEIR